MTKGVGPFFRSLFSLFGFCLALEKTHSLKPVLRNPESATHASEGARLKVCTIYDSRITSHAHPCEFVMTWAARKTAAKSSTAMRQYTTHRSIAGTPRISASRPLDVDVWKPVNTNQTAATNPISK